MKRQRPLFEAFLANAAREVREKGINVSDLQKAESIQGRLLQARCDASFKVPQNTTRITFIPAGIGDKNAAFEMQWDESRCVQMKSKVWKRLDGFILLQNDSDDISLHDWNN